MVLVWLVKDYGKPLKGLLVSPGLETVRYRAKLNQKHWMNDCREWRKKLTTKTHRHRNEVNISVYLKYEYLQQFALFSVWVFCCPRMSYSACVFSVWLETEKDVPTFPIGRRNLKGQDTNTGG